MMFVPDRRPYQSLCQTCFRISEFSSFANQQLRNFHLLITHSYISLQHTSGIQSTQGQTGMLSPRLKTNKTVSINDLAAKNAEDLVVVVEMMRSNINSLKAVHGTRISRQSRTEDHAITATDITRGKGTVGGYYVTESAQEGIVLGNATRAA